MLVAETPSGPATARPRRTRRRPSLRIYEWSIALPLLAWILAQMPGHGREFENPMLLMWAAAIAIVDLLPVPASIDLRFSLSFPLQLAAALIYSPPVAAIVAFLGTSDERELRRELPVGQSLFNRAQIAVSVAAESSLFHQIASLHSAWYRVGGAVVGATVIGYLINVALVAVAFHLQSREPLPRILRQMHVGIFGEFIVSYMGLALFGVLVATSFMRVGIWSVAVFIAPLAFARQMFLRTHSLEEATRELEAHQREQEYRALHDGLTDLPNRAMFLAARVNL